MTNSKLITAACDFSMSKRRTPRAGKPPVHYWNNEISKLRQECVRAQRWKTRMAAHIHRLRQQAIDSGVDFDHARAEAELEMSNGEHQDAKRELKIAILQSKKKCWTELIESVERDPFGKPYKMVMRKLGGGPPVTVTMESQCERTIIDTLFPNHDVTNELHQGHLELLDCELFSTQEVNDAFDVVRTRNKPPWTRLDYKPNYLGSTKSLPTNVSQHI